MINKSQKKVIEEARTPAVIIAGPGTGKTFTIVKKVVDLVKNEHIPANRILITTFTKKAAAELNSRILSEFTKENINTDLKDLKIEKVTSIDDDSKETDVKYNEQRPEESEANEEIDSIGLITKAEKTCLLYTSPSPRDS